MSALGGFVSQKDEIARLNNQIDMIAKFYKSFYKKEVDDLNKRINRLVVRECRTNKVLISLNIDRKLNRTERAVKLIKEGNTPLMRIATSCHLGYDTVKQISSKVNKGIY